MRTKAARDHNEPEIVQALREAGYFVTPLSDGGVPDLLVMRPDARHAVHRLHICTDADQALAAASRSPITLIEVKQDNGRLTKSQTEWWQKATASAELPRVRKSNQAKKGQNSDSLRAMQLWPRR